MFQRRCLHFWRHGVEGHVVSHLPRTSADLRRVYAEALAVRQAVMRAWIDARLDALVCPAMPTAAMTNEMLMSCAVIFSYTFPFNLLDYPAGIVPWTHVTKADVVECARAKVKQTPAHRRVFAWNASDEVVGLPIGVQVAAAPCREEMIVHVMRCLQREH